MSNLPAREQKQFIRSMFGRIAPRYDLMNRIMTAGQDLRWRKEAIRHANLRAGGLVLDLGAGTGDLAREALRQQPACRLVCADLTLEMMFIGQERTHSLIGEGAVLGWTAADAQVLPFPQGSFQAVVSGFLLRNVHDVRQSLADQYRVVEAGGWVVALDTNPPPKNMLTPVIHFHLRRSHTDPGEDHRRPSTRIPVPACFHRRLPATRRIIAALHRNRVRGSGIRAPDAGDGIDPLGAKTAE